MTTTVYQKFIPRYADTFTLIVMSEGIEFTKTEIIPSDKVAKLSNQEIEKLIEELDHWQNEKASWSDGEDETDEEDLRNDK